MDPVAILKHAIAIVQKCYALNRQMANNTGTADMFGARLNLLEDLLVRIQLNPELIAKSCAAVSRVADLLGDGADLAADMLSLKGPATFFSKAVSVGRRFLKAKTYGDQMTELSVQLTSAIGDLQVSSVL